MLTLGLQEFHLKRSAKRNMADQLNMGGLSLGDSQHAPNGVGAGRSTYIPPHLRGAGGPPPGMENRAPPPGPGPAGGPPPPPPGPGGPGGPGMTASAWAGNGARLVTNASFLTDIHV